MAFDISYNFRAKDKFSNVANKISRSFEKVNQKSKKAVSQNRKLASSFSKVKRSIGGANRKIGKFGRGIFNLKSAVGVAAVGFGFKKLIDIGSRFEDSLADLSAITGITGDQLQKSANTAKAFGKEFGVLPSVILDTIKQVASAKSELISIDGALEKVARSALILKSAAGVPLESAVETLTLSLNQFGASAQQSDRFINVLAAGSKVGASEVFETAEAIRNAGVVAKTSNVSFETLNSLIQVLAKNGIKAERAGTSLKNIITKLDIVFDQAGLSNLSLTQKLELLSKKTIGAEQAVNLFTQEGLAAGRVLVANIGLVKKWTKELTGTNIAQEQAAIRLATFSTRIAKLGIQIREKLIDLFFKLEPSLIKFTENIVNFLDSITPETIDKLADSAQTLVNILGKVVSVGTKISGIFGVLFDKRVLAGAAGGGVLGGPLGAIAGGTIGAAGGAIADFIGGKKGEGTTEGTINVNINAPKDTVRSVESKSAGPLKLNVGNNLGFATNGTL